MEKPFTTLFESATPEPPIGKSRTESVLPNWLKIAWFCLSPLGLSFAARIAWEKTVWTIDRGPQMVGFSLMHIHPGFFITGVLCAYLLILWLIPALIYMFVRREHIRRLDIVVIAITILAAAAMLIPDTFFVNGR